MRDREKKREEQRDTAKCLLEKQWKELEYRREREHKLSAWSMLLLAAAATIVAAASKPDGWKNGPPTDPTTVKHIFSIAAASLATLFGLFLVENRKRYEDTQHVLLRLQGILKPWDAHYWRNVELLGRQERLGTALLPEGWLRWGEYGVQIMPRLDTITHVVAIWVTAAAGTLIVLGEEWLQGVPWVLLTPVALLSWIRLCCVWNKVIGSERKGWGEPSEPV